MTLSHPTACVDSDVEIGVNVQIWQFASVIRGSKIGANASIGAGAHIDGARIGACSAIGAGAFICPGVVIEDDVFVGPKVTFCNDAWPRTHKRNYDYRKLFDGSVSVVAVRRGASIGAGAIILPGVEVGSDAMVAAGAVVTADVPNGCLWTRQGEIRPIRGEEKKERLRTC